MSKSVHIVVSSQTSGETFVVPYSHALGCQTYSAKGKPSAEPVLYKVASYAVRIDGGSSYKAIRFGLRNTGQLPPPIVRVCDVGLAADRECVPSWASGYSPHSFNGTSRSGAWQLLPHKGFLIHEGADASSGTVGGTLGCIEILDSRWNFFLAEIERLGGAGCAALGSAHKISVTIERAAYPVATLIKT